MNPTRILLVDDHAIFRQGLRKLFEEQKEFTVIGEASSGAEAVAAVTGIRHRRDFVDDKWQGFTR